MREPPTCPEGHVDLGVGGTFITVDESGRNLAREISGFSYCFQDDGRWHLDRVALSGSSDRRRYCAPIGSNIANINNLPRDMRTREAGQTFDGYHYLGWGGSFNHPGASFAGMYWDSTSSVWRTPSVGEVSGTNPRVEYAAPDGSPVVEANLAGAPAGIRNIPHDMPREMPEGYVVIGHYDDLVLPERSDGLYFRTWGRRRTWEPLGRGEVFERDSWYAARPSDLVAIGNRSLMEYYNSASQPEFPPLDKLPDLRTDHVHLGIMRGLNLTGDPEGVVDLSNSSYNSWYPVRADSRNYMTHWVAVHKDSPFVHDNIARARFYNPGMFPPPEPEVSGPILHHVEVNGVRAGDIARLEELLAPMMALDGNLKPLAADVWKAMEYGDPASRVDDWMEREPTAVALLEFHSIGKEDLAVEAFIETEKTLSELIVRATAGAMLKGGMSNHFTYQNGAIVAIPSNPPSLEQGYEMVRRTIDTDEAGKALGNYAMWALGQIGHEMEMLYGDAFDITNVMQQNQKSYNTYATALGTYRKRWATRRPELNYTIHKEAEYCKLPEEEKEHALDIAVHYKLRTLGFRKVLSYIRLYGSEGLRNNLPEDEESLMRRMDVRAVNKNYSFFLPTENKWFNYRGPFEYIPNGANPIINVDTRMLMNSEGTPIPMESWIPVGVEVPPPVGLQAALEASIAEAAPVDAVVERPRAARRVRTARAGTVDIVAEEAVTEATTIDHEAATAP